MKQVDRYKTSSFTKFLFKKAGFEAYLDNEELPLDLLFNKCDAVYADVKDASTLFTTKNYIELQDCKGTVLFTSKEGTSKLKEYDRVYRQAIRNAFASIEQLNEVYSTVLHKIFAKNSIETDDKKDLWKYNSTSVSDSDIKNLSNDPHNSNGGLNHATVTQTGHHLYAKRTDKGYQLINKQGLVVFILLNTSERTTFLIKDINGILRDLGDHWQAEYYKEGMLVLEKYRIHF